MSDIIVSSAAATFSGERGVDAYRIKLLASSLRMYVRHGIIPTRGVTISKMLKMAGEYTGKTYKRGSGEQAANDLDALMSERLESGHTTIERRDGLDTIEQSA